MTGAAHHFLSQAKRGGSIIVRPRELLHLGDKKFKFLTGLARYTLSTLTGQWLIYMRQKGGNSVGGLLGVSARIALLSD